MVKEEDFLTHCIGARLDLDMFHLQWECGDSAMFYCL